MGPEGAVAEAPTEVETPEPSGEAGSNGNGEEHPAEHEGDQPGEGNGEQALPPIALEGDGQLSLQIGGRKPDKATVKLRGGSIPIPAGQLKKGDVVNLMVKVQIAEVHVVDKIDNSTGEITETERRHIAKISGIEKIPS